MSELKPCPTCNSSDIKNIDGEHKVSYCFDCGTWAYSHMWNHRPIEDELRKRVAELEKERNRYKELLIEHSKHLHCDMDDESYITQTMRISNYCDTCWSKDGCDLVIGEEE